MRNGMIENKWRDRGWYSIGKLDRTDGPAVEYSDGAREWWLNGVEYTEEEYNTEMRLRRCGLSVNVPYEWKSTVDSSA